MISRSHVFRLQNALSFTVPLALALLLQLYVAEPLRDAHGFHIALTAVRTDSAAELSGRMADYVWPPAGPVPRLGVIAFPHDLSELSVAERKSMFFRVVLPLAMAENARIERIRARVEQTFARGHLYRGTHDYRFVRRVAREYRVTGSLNDPSTRAALLRRVDVIPLGLVLAQAANESAWGTSRFVREGNALFGQWTWVADAGITPLRRAAGARHRVRAYADLRGSVRAYLHNLNTGHAYGELRVLRERMRGRGRIPDAFELAGALQRYSERGPAYVAELRSLMRSNDLDTLPPVTLAPLPGVISFP